MPMVAQFSRCIGIDYSGAKTPTSPLPGLQVFVADDADPVPIRPEPPQPLRRNWTRQALALWLVDILRRPEPLLVGIDHGFGFPLDYFEACDAPRDWTAFLADFTEHWPTHLGITVDDARRGRIGNAAARQGDARWRRLAEIRTRRAKSVFHFDVPGSVAKSTHAGLPWLLYLRRLAGRRVHFWPFDGWEIPSGLSVVAEAYPALCNQDVASGQASPHAHDAYALAAWLRRCDLSGELPRHFAPRLTTGERRTANVEGWILGVP